MIVAVDARHLAGGRGVAHYTSALLAAMEAGFPEDEFRRYVPRAHLRRPLFASAALLGRPRLDRLAGGADVAWIPAPAPVAVSRDVPYVLSVMDVSWLERPGDFTTYERVWHRIGRLDRLARAAAAVVCISAATRDAMQRAWHLPDERVHVVHPGVTAPDLSGPRGHSRPYFLAVGALEPRKAPDLLVRAHARARAQGLQADLVFAGRGRIPVGGDGVVALGRVEDLGALYRDALALVMPSYLEGFGFPPLEAALAGTPSIVADLPVYDETLGAAAVRFPAGDEAALAAALLAVERDGAPVADVAHLTWERAAAAQHEILRSVA